MLRHFIALLLLVCALAPSATEAAIYRVGSDAGCTHATIQAAIDAAAAAVGASEIRIRAGVHVDTVLAIGNETDALALVGGFAQCADEGPQPEARSTLQGGVGAPILTIVDATNVTLRNLVLADAVTGYDGAGIYYLAASGELTLLDTTIRGNIARYGAGIAIVNPDPQAAPDALRVVLRGWSSVQDNIATHGDGGGIYCVRATVRFRDQALAANNEATLGNGGAIAGQDCHIEIASRGAANVVLQANRAPAGHGGALHLAGPAASAMVYSTLGVPRFDLNSARYGGAIAARGGARVDVFEGRFTQNTAETAGGAIWLADGGATGYDTRFTMHGSLAGAPADAAACALGEACNSLAASAAEDANGVLGSGAAIFIDSTAAGMPSGSAHARFEGTRISFSRGYSLIAQTSADSHIVLDGAVVDTNVLGSFIAVTTAATSSIDIVASTIAGNTLGAGSTVLFGPLGCSVDSEARGTRLERAIVWQPGHALLATFGGTPQADCYRHLVGNLFSGLPDSPERLVADPDFVDPANGDYRLALYSPALDFAPAHPSDATRDGGPRVFDLSYIGNHFGAQDLGAYEEAPDDLIFANGFE
jgi:hypothetical protein